MAEKTEGQETGAAEASGAGVDPAAAALAQGGASREKADAFLDDQRALIAFQNHHLAEPSPDDQDDNNAKTLAGLVVAILLVAVTVFLLLKLKQGTALLDCIAAGHHNCAPIDTSKM